MVDGLYYVGGNFLGWIECIMVDGMSYGGGNVLIAEKYHYG